MRWCGGTRDWLGGVPRTVGVPTVGMASYLQAPIWPHGQCKRFLRPLDRCEIAALSMAGVLRYEGGMWGKRGERIER